MTFTELMTAFGNDAELEDFLPDADGDYRVCIDGTDITFMEHAGAGRLFIWAFVNEDKPMDFNAEVCHLLLEAMFMGSGTSGATFSLEPERHLLCLHCTEQLENLTYEKFKATLEKFVSVLEQWRRILEDYVNCSDDIQEIRDFKREQERTLNLGQDNFLRP